MDDVDVMDQADRTDVSEVKINELKDGHWLIWVVGEETCTYQCSACSEWYHERCMVSLSLTVRGRKSHCLRAYMSCRKSSPADLVPQAKNGNDALEGQMRILEMCHSDATSGHYGVKKTFN